MTGRRVLLCWVGTRLLTLLMLFTYASRVIGDVNYYRHALEALPSAGLAQTLMEYPLPAVAVVGVPWLLSAGGGAAAYIWLFLLFAVATDGAFTAMLHRADERRAGAVLTWLLMVPALGAVTFTRFDLLPGVLVGLMVLWHARRPRAAALALTVATCVKLWPAILLPSLVAASRRRRAVLAVVGVGGAVAVALIVALAGIPRLLSPLTYQGERGLQIESLAATPAMVLRWLRPEGTQVWYAPSKAWEITGPGVGTLLTLTTVASVLFAVGLVAAWCRTLAGPRVADSDTLVWLTIAATTGFIALGRVLSPQYLLWLGPVCAAGLVVTGPTRRTLLRWSGGLLLTAALTQLVFPVTYTGLLADDRPAAVSVVLLVLRNLAVLWLLVVATRMAWRTTVAAGQHRSVTDRTDRAEAAPAAVVAPALSGGDPGPA